MPRVPTSAAAALTLRSPASLELDVQAEKLPDSNPSAKIRSDPLGVFVAVLVRVGEGPALNVEVAVKVGEGVNVGPAVGVLVLVAVTVGVFVLVGVLLGVDVPEPAMLTSHTCPSFSCELLSLSTLRLAI